MTDFLDAVVGERLADAREARERVPWHVVERAAADAPAPRGFGRALARRRSEGRLALIAEVKRTSPALGDLAPDLDPASLARAYAAGGASAISVLTEPRHWGGSLDDLVVVREASPLPVLCKDVIVDAYQVLQARAAGADAVLLIAEALDERGLRALVGEATALGLDVLVEAHERAAFERAVEAGATILGVNARDLREPARIDPDRVGELAPLVPAGSILVAESGIGSAADAARLPGRVDAVLVGTALVRAGDPGALLGALGRVARPSPVSA